jgi:hypothetical protein
MPNMLLVPRRQKEVAVEQDGKGGTTPKKARSAQTYLRMANSAISGWAGRYQSITVSSVAHDSGATGLAK